MELLTNDLIAARSTMAFSLAFHIIFASIGMVMPFFMATSHFIYLRKKDPLYLELTKMWSKGVAILFATGAVTGTVLSFELGLLWPNFMQHAGPIIGMPFSWEGTAFFLEAIAIGIFFYGWDKIPPWAHWFSGFIVGVAGLTSGIFIISANSWMNTPSGFDWINGQAHNIDPVKAMFNKHWFQQTLHMSLATFVSVGFAVAGIHAFYLLKRKRKVLNQKALIIALTFASVASLIQPFSGHHSAQQVALNQPLKLAAFEAHYETQTKAPLTLAGVTVPGALSFLAFGNTEAEVKGLNSFPQEEWPPVTIVHYAFLLMVGIGTLLAVVALFFLIRIYMQKKELPTWFFKLALWLSPLGFLALEAGWTVTEVGRQPWIIYGVMKTKDAVSSVPGLGVHFVVFMLLYVVVGSACTFLLHRLIKNFQHGIEGSNHAD